MTPVLHVGYEEWEARALRKKPVLAAKGAALAHFDRAQQLGVVNPLLTEFRAPAETCGYALFWYGGPRQGVAAFHAHLCHTFGLPGHAVRELPHFSWPRECLADASAFSVADSLLSALLEVFKVMEASEISQSLRASLRASEREQRQLWYLPVPLPPIGSGLEVRLQLLLSFLEVWDEKLSPHFEEPFIPLLGLALEVPDTSQVEGALADWGEAVSLRAMRFLPLPGLGPVAPLELSNHLRDAAPKLGAEERRKLVSAILAQTAGRYDDVVEILANGSTPRPDPGGLR
jgi:hypothetical protein